MLNYVVLQKEAFEGLKIERKTIMRWPGSSMTDLNVRSVSTGTAPALVIHWAGMKHTLLRKMAGADLLLFFERFYYSRMPAGRIRRAFAIVHHVWLQCVHKLRWRAKLQYRKWARQPAKSRPEVVTESIRA